MELVPGACRRLAEDTAVALHGDRQYLPDRDPSRRPPRVLARHRGERRRPADDHSTVTLFARFRGWSTSQPLRTAMSYASSCSGSVITIALSRSGPPATSHLH